MTAPRIAPSGQWDIFTVYGLPLLGLLALALLVGAGLFARAARHDDLTPDLFWVLAAVLVVAAMADVGGTVAAYWPFDSQYHQYRDVSGTVDHIASRFVAADRATDQKFVVTFDGSSQQFGVTDTRAALLKPGDTVSLRCIRVYDYGSDNAGYDCKWGQS